MTSAESPRRLDARALRDLVLDPGSWRSWDVPVPPRAVDDSYAGELAAARIRSGQDEFCRRMARVLAEELAGLLGRDPAERMRSRGRRWRRLGR